MENLKKPHEIFMTAFLGFHKYLAVLKVLKAFLPISHDLGNQFY